MTGLIERTLCRLEGQLPGRISRPGDNRYIAATALWAKPIGRMPRAVVHSRTPQDVQLAILAARDSALSLSVRGGGHDWAGRALCDGLVIDLSGMNDVLVDADHRTARISGGARASDVLSVTDPRGLAAVTGSCGAVGMAGLTLGGGYGPLIGRFGLALDNVIAADVVLADGRIVTAEHEREDELFWALRGGGGNFGVVTAMRIRLHNLPNVLSGMLVYPFSEAKSVLEGCIDIAASMPDDLTVQLGFVTGPDGAPLVLVVPTWCGPPGQGDAQVAPLLRLGTVLDNSLDAIRYGASLAALDAYIVNGQRSLIETCWLPALDSRSIDVFIEAMETAVSPGCAVFTHEFRGAASRVAQEATAFGLRRHHLLIEILATFVDRSDESEEQRHQRWARATLAAFNAMALPGGYPNMLAGSEVERATKSFGRNAERLIKAKRHYDPDNVFRCAIPLPVDRSGKRASAAANDYKVNAPEHLAN
jgi:FAD/FMN-containing dehydrogenase